MTVARHRGWLYVLDVMLCSYWHLFCVCCGSTCRFRNRPSPPTVADTPMQAPHVCVPPPQGNGRATAHSVTEPDQMTSRGAGMNCICKKTQENDTNKSAHRVQHASSMLLVCPTCRTDDTIPRETQHKNTRVGTRAARLNSWRVLVWRTSRAS